MKIIFLGFFAISLAIAASGCNRYGDERSLCGTYVGSLRSENAASTTETALDGNVSKLTGHLYALNAYEDQKNLGYFEINIRSGKKIELSSTLYDQKSISLRSDGSGCYLGNGVKTGKVSVCRSEQELYIDIEKVRDGSAYHLSLSRMDIYAPPAPIPPRSYSLKEVEAITFARNFDSNIEAYNFTKTRLNAKLLHQSLFPHLNPLNDLIPIGTGDSSGTLSAVSDLMPFLFPSRWYQAKAAKAQSDAERDTLLITRATAAFSAESMVYDIIRDLKGLDFMAANIEDHLKPLYMQLKAREKDGPIQANTAKLLKDIVLDSSQSMQTAELTLRQEWRALATIMGFPNTDAVTGLDEKTIADDPELSIAHAVSFTDEEAQEFIETVQNSAFELRQARSVLRAADYLSTSGRMEWIDPIGNYGSFLGINLRTYYTMADLQGAQQELIYDKIRQGVADSALEVVQEIDNEVKAYKLSLKTIALDNAIVRDLIRQTAAGTGFDTQNIPAVLQDYSQNMILAYTIEAAYRTSLAKKKLLLKEGFYSRLAIPDNTGF